MPTTTVHVYHVKKDESDGTETVCAKTNTHVPVGESYYSGRPLVGTTTCLLFALPKTLCVMIQVLGRNGSWRCVQIQPIFDIQFMSDRQTDERNDAFKKFPQAFLHH